MRRGEGGRFLPRKTWLVTERQSGVHYEWKEYKREEVEVLGYTESGIVCRVEDGSITRFLYGRVTPSWDYERKYRCYVEMEPR